MGAGTCLSPISLQYTCNLPKYSIRSLGQDWYVSETNNCTHLDWTTQIYFFLPPNALSDPFFHIPLRDRFINASVMLNTQCFIYSLKWILPNHFHHTTSSFTLLRTEDLYFIYFLASSVWFSLSSFLIFHFSRLYPPSVSVYSFRESSFAYLLHVSKQP